MGTLPKRGSVEVVVDATPEEVWAVVTDVRRAGEWSHETRGGEWLDGADRCAPGARFRGRNGHRAFRWARVCEVEEAEAPTRFAWRTVRTRRYPDSTRWRIELHPVEGGTRVVQSFEVLQIHPLAERLFYVIVPAHRDRLDALRDDLRRLGEVAAGRPAAMA